MAILRLTAATLFPVALSALFTVLEHKKALARWSETAKQMVIGITFGIFCILSTEYGVDTGEGVILNVRDAGPMCAGLFFGTPAILIPFRIRSRSMKFACTATALLTETGRDCEFAVPPCFHVLMLMRFSEIGCPAACFRCPVGFGGMEPCHRLAGAGIPAGAGVP